MARKSLVGWVKTLALAGVFATGASAASAQYQYCVEHGDLVAHLTENFQERQFALGLIGQEAIMEVFVAESGSWTIIVTDVAGRSCIVAAGDNWESVVALSGQNS
ncbi:MULTISPECIES: hypothetical protein [unclassified Mesorhizobium]|uniref:hypothetical protein n=1 Tax=unclassified Mesorhizobium TaxID=325217 RepID=UPI000FDB751A|nr:MULTISPECIES: hypothetical protein [unclassified Mesorhizobium]TGQ43981.1 hypothetical protein EN859_009530 [Mesorhizobium sp. M00.F.Ca.ET.216.01.1.1]TIS59125.1 MAG: hypothetical protein E5W91_06570 [Mesorhizobium sp.]TIS90815.1 MAG: hypothetical protein E5W89_10565 [Mesorhizobium sp.]TJW48524.1 MAG: hypothetical protein E5W83_02635 [Mesorhizobium sp.]